MSIDEPSWGTNNTSLWVIFFKWSTDRYWHEQSYRGFKLADVIYLENKVKKFVIL